MNILKKNKEKENKKSSEVIKLDQVYKVYDLGKVKVEALKGISLTIKKGEFVAILGPSGAGKSTLMNMIGCLDTPTKGKIFLFGQDISKLSESDLATLRGKKIGFIFQQFNLVPYLTALENVTLPMLFQGINRKVRIKKAMELLKIVKLEHRANHKPNELSGGQQQRVAIARALANDPELILADEPTGNLDTKTGETIMDFLKHLNKNFNKTIVIVTHDKKIGQESQRQIFIKDGKIVNHL